MAMIKQEYKKDCMILSTLEELVPKEYLVRKIFVQIMKFYLIVLQIKRDINNINQILINV